MSNIIALIIAFYLGTATSASVWAHTVEDYPGGDNRVEEFVICATVGFLIPLVAALVLLKKGIDRLRAISFGSR